MAIEKMRLLSITGNNEKLDYIIAKYLLKSGIQLENAPKVLEKGWKLTYFSYNSDIRDLTRKTENVLKALDISFEPKDIELKNSYEEIKENIEKIDNNILEKQKELENKKKEIENLKKKIEPIEHLKNVNVEIDKMYSVQFIKFRYGKIPTENMDELKESIKDMDVIIVEADKNDEETWLLYFTVGNKKNEVDSLFQVLNFERIWISEDVIGTAKDYIYNANSKILDYEKEIETLQKYFEELKRHNESILKNYYNQLVILEKVNVVKKYIAYDSKNSFYIVGWLPYDNLQKILPDLKKEDVECIVKTNDEVPKNAPTKLKNNRLVRPFEMIVKMYGVPNYTEHDPTTFVAITAFLMFGFMFGDVGQGFVFLLIGLILAKKKKELGPILVAGGISSIIFGFLYGSIFGMEDVIKPILVNPMENITTMLGVGIASGAILIIIAMILNIKNGIKNKDKGKIFFDKNGLAGLIFYIAVLAIAVGYLVKGKIIANTGFILLLVVVPLIIIMFKENLVRLMEKKKKSKNEEKNSLIEKIFEIIEMLLSVMSNTISFVRLAAFAINHVGLCMAVFILSDMVSGAGSIAIVIFGNALVIVLEGLIVAIQVLRLEYYELFSRFYSGDGREYKPI